MGIISPDFYRQFELPYLARVADAFRRIGDNMFIKGNIDSVNILLGGTDESIRADVGERMRIGMANKGFILSTACSI
jgi:uroporphyrinogen-III decarboxylase